MPSAHRAVSCGISRWIDPHGTRTSGASGSAAIAGAHHAGMCPSRDATRKDGRRGHSSLNQLHMGTDGYIYREGDRTNCEAWEGRAKYRSLAFRLGIRSRSVGGLRIRSACRSLSSRVAPPGLRLVHSCARTLRVARRRRA